jgi:hypothetical protein
VCRFGHERDEIEIRHLLADLGLPGGRHLVGRPLRLLGEPLLLRQGRENIPDLGRRGQREVVE